MNIIDIYIKINHSNNNNISVGVCVFNCMLLWPYCYVKFSMSNQRLDLNARFDIEYFKELKSSGIITQTDSIVLARLFF